MNVNLSISLNERLVTKIENERGDVSRSKFINKILSHVLDEEAHR